MGETSRPPGPDVPTLLAAALSGCLAHQCATTATVLAGHGLERYAASAVRDEMSDGVRAARSRGTVASGQAAMVAGVDEFSDHAAKGSPVTGAPNTPSRLSPGGQLRIRPFRATMCGRDTGPGWACPAGRFWIGQILLVGIGVVVYFTVRAATVGSSQQSRNNALRVLDLERWLGIDIETRVQRLVEPHEVLVALGNWIYIWLHWPVIVAVLAWLLWKHPRRYPTYRNVLLITGLIGMIIVARFPVMPPRLLGIGLVDTVTEHSRSYRVLQPPAFVNPYAAMPSFHVGWDLLMGIALIREARHRWLRAAGWALPPLMFVSVVSTANHFVIDGIVGDLLVLSVLSLVEARDSSAVPSQGEDRAPLPADHPTESSAPNMGEMSRPPGPEVPTLPAAARPTGAVPLATRGSTRCQSASGALGRRRGERRMR